MYVPIADNHEYLARKINNDHEEDRSNHLTNVIEPPVLSYEIMEKADTQDGILFSTLINDKSLVARHGSLDDLVAAIQRLIGLGMIESQHYHDEEEGDDYLLLLTKTGSSILHQPHT